MNKQIITALEKICITPTAIKKQAWGTSRNSYLIVAKEGVFVLKLYSKRKKHDIQRQITVLHKINKITEITIKPVHENTISFGNKVGFVYPFVDGIHFHDVKIPRKLYAFGKLVGKFTRQAQPILSEEKSNLWIKKTIAESRNTIKELEKQKNNYYTTIASLMKRAMILFKKEYDDTKYRSQLIHGDLHFHNVLYDTKRRKATIIDTELDRGILVCEIMVILSYLITHSPKKNKKVFREIIHGYETEHTLLKKEKKAIPILMIPRKLGEIMWLQEGLKKKKYPKKFFLQCMKNSTEQLEIILEQFGDVKKICSTL